VLNIDEFLYKLKHVGSIYSMYLKIGSIYSLQIVACLSFCSTTNIFVFVAFDHAFKWLWVV